MIDINEPTFTLVASPYMRVGFCVVKKGKDVIYTGPIRDCPGVDADEEMTLHPSDFKSLDAWIRKHNH